jgi:transcriptional repressor NrdR
MVVKSDGRRQPFDIKKIERGISHALEKRPVSQLKVEQILGEVEDEAALEGKQNHEIAQ